MVALAGRLKCSEIKKPPIPEIMAITNVIRIIFIGELEKFLAIAAGRIKRAVIKNIPMIFTLTAINNAKIKENFNFKLSTLIPSIIAKSLLIVVSKSFLK